MSHEQRLKELIALGSEIQGSEIAAANSDQLPMVDNPTNLNHDLNQMEKIEPNNNTLDIVLGPGPVEKTRAVGAFVLGMFTMYALHSLIMVVGVIALIYGCFIFFKKQQEQQNPPQA